MGVSLLGMWCIMAMLISSRVPLALLRLMSLARRVDGGVVRTIGPIGTLRRYRGILASELAGAGVWWDLPNSSVLVKSVF